MNILIAGSSTILGSACIEYFFNEQHTLFTLDTLPEESNEIEAVLAAKTQGLNIDMLILTESEALLNGPTTSHRLRVKQDQLLHKTARLFDILSARKNTLKTLIITSSIQIYGDEKKPLGRTTEHSKIYEEDGADFYVKLEKLTSVFKTQDVRIIILRLGKVVSPIFEPASVKLPFTRRLLLRVLGDSTKKISWISQDDAIAAISFLLKNPAISGVVNLTSGDLISSTEYYELISRKFDVLQLVPLPRQILRFIVGNELYQHLDTYNEAVPAKLMQAGFLFKDISLAEYLLDKAEAATTT